MKDSARFDPARFDLLAQELIDNRLSAHHSDPYEDPEDELCTAYHPEYLDTQRSIESFTESLKGLVDKQTWIVLDDAMAAKNKASWIRAEAMFEYGKRCGRALANVWRPQEVQRRAVKTPAPDAEPRQSMMFAPESPMEPTSQEILDGLYAVSRHITLMARLIDANEGCEFESLDEDERQTIAETLRAAADACDQLHGATERLERNNARARKESVATLTAVKGRKGGAQ